MAELTSSNFVAKQLFIDILKTGLQAELRDWLSREYERQNSFVTMQATRGGAVAERAKAASWRDNECKKIKLIKEKL